MDPSSILDNNPRNEFDSSPPFCRLKSIRFPSLGVVLRWSLLLAGVGLLIGCQLGNWFDIPVPMGDEALHFDEISRQSPECQRTFQLLIATGLIGFIIARMVQRRWTLLASLIACTMISMTLAFPYFVMLGEPVLAADATNLQLNHDNLTWLGGDINSAAESGQMAWKSKVYWVDLPRQIAVAPLPTWSAWDVGLNKIEDLLIWVGFSNVFCQFVRPGWFFALLGSFILAVVTVISSGRLKLRQAGYAICYLSLIIVIGVAVALSGPFRVKSHLHDASTAMSDGDNQRALTQLQTCSELFPVLTQDTYYIAQRALIEHRLALGSDYARLFHASRDETIGRYDRSFAMWKSLCDSNDEAIQREALRAVLRFAIQDYNSQRISLARKRLEFVLHRQPGNVKAIYLMQILGIREDNPAEVYLMCDWMYAVTDHLNFSSTKILKAVSQQHAQMAAALDGDMPETWVRSIGARNP